MIILEEDKTLVNPIHGNVSVVQYSLKLTLSIVTILLTQITGRTDSSVSVNVNVDPLTSYGGPRLPNAQSQSQLNVHVSATETTYRALRRADRPEHNRPL